MKILISERNQKMNNPEKRFKCGLVSASIFAEVKVIDNEEVKFYSINIARAYKKSNGENGNKEGEWKYTNSFGPEDLPKVALVANEAYRYIRLNSTNSNEQNIESQ